MSNKQIVWEMPGPDGTKTRLVLENDSLAAGLSFIKHDGDVFLVTPDHRVVAALVRMEQAAAPSLALAG